MQPNALPFSPSAPVAAAAEAHLRSHQNLIWRRTDRFLAGLLIFEWVGAVALACWRSPRTWNGATASIHPHLWAAIFLGFAIISLPIALAIMQPARTVTRHTIAVGQMLMSALLIHLGDGRIEMHFHIFGSLAFLAFYRDWRVLLTATAVVVADHTIRGLYLPESIYGVMSSTFTRTVEHAWWVLFEDIFLVGSCIQGQREMQGIAMQRALLEQSHVEVERKVTERTAELKNTQQELMKAARSAGMAEIATSVLHNVGNVLNSVNVSATLVTDKLRQSEVASLTKVSEMMTEHQPDLANYLTQDERGKLIPAFITELATCLGEEQSSILSEVQSLSGGIAHIKRIVAAQQSMAKTAKVQTRANPASLIENAISLGGVSGVDIHRRIVDSPDVMLDEHKVLQILINLLSNARHAVMIRPIGQRIITMSMEPLDIQGEQHIRYQVTDNGGGIATDHLTRIFSHGFTTKKEGHGFGLHSAANAAKEMGGSLLASSDGLDKGATFTLDIPASAASHETPEIKVAGTFNAAVHSAEGATCRI